MNTIHKEEFSAAFQKMHDSAKACIYANGAYFELKKKMCISYVSLILKKKLSSKTFGPHCVIHKYLRFNTTALILYKVFFYNCNSFV